MRSALVALLASTAPAMSHAYSIHRVHSSGRMRCISPAMVLLEPLQSLSVSTSSAHLMDCLLQRFNGHFDNYAQAVADEKAGLSPREGGGHEHIHCALRAVDVAPVGPACMQQHHVLASYYFDGQPDAIFRERLYAFEAVEQDAQFGACVRMSIYRLRESRTTQLRAANRMDSGQAPAAGGVLFSSADVVEELRVPGADVFWRLCGQTFEGRMRTDAITIVSERTGRDLIVRDDVTLFSDALWVNDRGWDADTGEYMYGNIHAIPYQMDRVPDEHWTVTGSQPPKR
jgi:hypothetical protein